jgi:hypothetical protein
VVLDIQRELTRLVDEDCSNNARSGDDASMIRRVICRFLSSEARPLFRSPADWEGYPRLEAASDVHDKCSGSRMCLDLAKRRD